jgi:hypothetical protein
MEVKMKNESRLLNESFLREELEDESAIDERDEEDEEEEEEEEIYPKAIRTIEIHERNADALYSGAGMYWLGMSIGWKAFRVLHTRRSSSTLTIRGIRKHYLYGHSLLSPAAVKTSGQTWRNSHQRKLPENCRNKTAAIK